MTTYNLVAWRFLGIFFLGCVFLSYPVMTLFNIEVLLFGIPLLYLYIFLLWLVIIFLIYLVSKQNTPVSPDSFFSRKKKSE